MAKVLLIEADRPMAGVIKSFLETKDHEVQWHVDPQTAMDSADADMPQVVVLDLVLAGRSGVEFLYEFRSYPDWQDLPVILYSHISANDLGPSVAGFEQLNVAALHYKPATKLSELNESINKIAAPAKVR
jgi:DNA-binding response OmpR family regulator